MFFLKYINHQRIRIIVKIGVYTFLHSLDDRNEIQKKPTISGEDLARCILCRVICAQNRPSADTPVLCRIGSSFDLKPPGVKEKNMNLVQYFLG